MDELKIADRIFNSRLFIGTGKFPAPSVMSEAVRVSGSELVTAALRRMDFDSASDEFISNLDLDKVLLVPNTSGARTAREAVRLSELAREAGGGDWVKLELTPEPRYLLPDPIETLLAAEELVKKNFKVLPYINADPLLAKRLEDAGCPAVMPLGAPIGTNRGLRTRDMLEIIIEAAGVPVIVDAGLGMPSHAAAAMEMGAAAVLVNTAIASAGDPVETAEAFALAVKAGRKAFLYSRVDTSKEARASSPAEGFLDSLDS